MDLFNFSVITGVRFAESKNTIYLEIEVGQMLPMGIIKPSSVHWQGPPENMLLHTFDFHFVSRMFYLDMVEIDTGFLTGIQLFVINGSLRLRAYSKEFDNFEEGQISYEESSHFDNDKTSPLFNLQDKIPMTSPRPGKIATNWNYNIFFGTSSQKGNTFRSNIMLNIYNINHLADAGQSTVPYFDSTDITFDIKTPLGGIGFFHHTSNSDYAGYIRPVILSLNYTKIAKIEKEIPYFK